MGLSYRVVYRRDPVPAHKHRRLNCLLADSLVHVHGEIYIDDEQLTPGKQPYGNHFNGDVEDHGFMRYAEVTTLCKLCRFSFLAFVYLVKMHTCSLPGAITSSSIIVVVITTSVTLLRSLFFRLEIRHA